MILQRCVAGSMVKESLYRERSPNPPGSKRAPRSSPTNTAKQLLNFKYSWQKLALYLAANFQTGDIVGTLTFDQDHRPLNRKQANQSLSYFKRKLRIARRLCDRELVMFWSIEHVHEKGRYHIHFVCNGDKNDYDEIDRLWNYGKVTQHVPLLVNNEKNYISQARYMAKEAREKPGLQIWSHTTNIRKPEISRETVPENYHLQPPKNPVVHDWKKEESPFGMFEYQMYIDKN